MELMNVVILKCSQLFHLFFALMVASANRLYNESCNRSSLKGMFVSHTETCGDPTVSYKPPTHLRGLILFGCRSKSAYFVSALFKIVELIGNARLQLKTLLHSFVDAQLFYFS